MNKKHLQIGFISLIAIFYLTFFVAIPIKAYCFSKEHSTIKFVVFNGLDKWIKEDISEMVTERTKAFHKKSFEIYEKHSSAQEIYIKEIEVI